MERLSGIDAAFTYLETPNAHMHVAMTAILDTETMPGGYSFEAIRQLVLERMHLVAPFRRRLVNVPFNLNHPIWIEDPDFDIDFHVHRGTLQLPEAVGSWPNSQPASHRSRSTVDARCGRSG